MASCIWESSPSQTTKPSALFLKAILRHMVVVTSSTYSFTLPSHKANRFFEGNTVLIKSRSSRLSPLHPFVNYLTAQDAHFPLHPHLWLTSAGTPPTYSWVVRRLKGALGQDVAGHSLRSGGATALTIAGTPNDHIQARGRWTSQSYQIYIRKHPVMLQSLLHVALPSIYAHNHSPVNHLSSSPHLLLQYGLGSYALLKKSSL